MAFLSVVRVSKYLPASEAFGVTMILVNNVFWALLTNLVFRDPRYGLLWALSPMLCTTGAICSRKRFDRISAIGINLLEVAFFQWILSFLSPLFLLQTAALFVIIFLAAQRKNAANSCVVMVATVSGLGNQVTYLIGLDILLSMCVTILFILPSAWFWDRFLLKDWSGLPERPPLTPGQIGRHIGAYGSAMACYFGLNLTFGSWIPLTVGLCYMKGSVGAEARQTAMLRVATAPFGLLLGIAFLSAFSYMDYTFSYTVILWGALGYFLSYYTGRFEIFYIPFLIMLCCAHNISYGQSPLFGNGWNYFFQSVVGIGIGGSLVLLWEMELPTLGFFSRHNQSDWKNQSPHDIFPKVNPKEE